MVYKCRHRNIYFFRTVVVTRLTSPHVTQCSQFPQETVKGHLLIRECLFRLGGGTKLH